MKEIAVYYIAIGETEDKHSVCGAWCELEVDTDVFGSFKAGFIYEQQMLDQLNRDNAYNIKWVSIWNIYDNEKDMQEGIEKFKRQNNIRERHCEYVIGGAR